MCMSVRPALWFVSHMCAHACQKGALVLELEIQMVVKTKPGLVQA